jgi:hypothetical protein
MWKLPSLTRISAPSESGTSQARRRQRGDRGELRSQEAAPPDGSRSNVLFAVNFQNVHLEHAALHELTVPLDGAVAAPVPLSVRTVGASQTGEQSA